MRNSQMVGMNERGLRIGEGHHNARYSDAEIEAVVVLLAFREEALRLGAMFGLSYSACGFVLSEMQLSYREIARKLDVSKSHVCKIAHCDRRSQVVAKWKRVHDRVTTGLSKEREL